ncbi:hypothetical protein AnaeK_1025 [Anaeromyxobacter sp. K]|uniref:hypothetical protein n=1 Tax=Anaeromyxobacter sp. (strain K) TaxID=447217 RepID=UPI00015F9D05|nr:hypothetical protein [Anaeromyxobacter sp. K]ACG72260.1 hypothetical protein AnaeK_1025 [Anaeromyxobacter sp. K]
MKGEPKDQPRKDPGKAPRTDLPPTREPYDEGYFGTGEEEGVERERQAPEPAKDRERGR